MSNGSVTEDAQHGEAAFTLTGGSKIGASGSLTVTQPFENLPFTLTVVANNTTAQVGYAFFSTSGTRISSASPLSVSGPVNPYQQPNIPVSLKPVNVFGRPLAATFTDGAQLAPVQPKSEAGMPASSYSGPGVTLSEPWPPYAVSESALVKKGTTSMNLEFSPGTGGLYVLTAIPQKLVAQGAVITALRSSSGTVLIPVLGSAGNSTVTGVQPNTTYQVTAQLLDQYGEVIAESAYSGTPSITISCSATRGTPAMVSAPSTNAGGQWTFTYVTGSSANASDTLSLGTGETLTTNSY